jgi:hypothetical protein
MIKKNITPQSTICLKGVKTRHGLRSEVHRAWEKPYYALPSERTAYEIGEQI